MPSLSPDARADRVLVEKAAHVMTLLDHGAVLRQYRIALGSGGLEPKRHAGDRRTPEGLYRIDAHPARSAFHRALHISYPSPAERAAAALRGEDPGGDILVHGLRAGTGWLGSLHRLTDWTGGCIAVTDAEIDEIARAVPDGTPIEIRP